MIEALRREIKDTPPAALPDQGASVNHDLEQILSQRLPVDLLENALRTVRAVERIFGLHTGTIWISDDFDDELPDEFWLGEDA